MNLLYRYITQGRVEADRPHLSPRRVSPAPAHPARRPQRQPAGHCSAELTAACPEMTSLASAGRLLRRPAPARSRQRGQAQGLGQAARASDLPDIHAFTRGLDLDPQAVTAAVTLPFHNGRTEGVNTKTKMIKRQMYGRAGFTLLRHRILLS